MSHLQKNSLLILERLLSDQFSRGISLCRSQRLCGQWVYGRSLSVIASSGPAGAKVSVK